MTDAPMGGQATSSRPLCVKLNGTLVRGDVFPESVFALIRQDITSLFRLPFWLLKGKAYLKQQVASRVATELSLLPFHEPFVEFLREERARGRPLVLVTGSNQLSADRVADQLGIFDEVIASDAVTNLTAPEKKAALVARYGEKGFDYAGTHATDMQVWRSAYEAIVVSPTRAVTRATQSLDNVSQVFPRIGSRLGGVVRVMRPHQWLKNLLIFLPLLAAHEVGNLQLLFNATLAFMAFSLTASTAYVINDLFDAQSDRHHWRKKKRPFASGQLSSTAALPLVFVFLGIAGLLAVSGPPVEFLLVLVGYFVLTLLYSFKLKRAILIDVVTLAGLYTIRVIAGSAATGITASVWLLAFSMFLFLSLALVKRYAELFAAISDGSEDDTLKGRGYRKGDLQLLQSMGCSSGYVAVLVLALYIISDDVSLQYEHPYLIWLLCPLLLYWISRAWIVVVRQELTDDPLVWAVQDQISRWIAGIAALILILAT